MKHAGKRIMEKVRTNFILKMTLTAFFLLIVPGVMVLLLTCGINYQSLNRQMLTFNQQLLEQTGAQWKESMEEISAIPLTLYQADSEVLSALRSTGKYTSKEQEQLTSIMAAMLSMNKNLIGIKLAGNNGKILREYRFVSQTRWQTYAEGTEFSEGFQTYMLDGKPYFGVYRICLIDYPAYEMLADVTLYFSLTEWDMCAENLGGGQKSYAIRLIDANGRILYYYGRPGQTDSKLAQSRHMIYKGCMDKLHGYYFVEKMEVQGRDFRIVKFFPDTEITGRIFKTVVPLGILNILLMACMIIYLCFVYGKILHPIRRIVENMKKIQDGVYVYDAMSDSPDEIGRLERQYDAMVKDIDRLVNQTMKQEIEVIQTKLKVLQAQINPHFLNNMLQMISTQAVCEEAVQTDKMLCSLARLLQYNMETDRDEVTMDEEFRNIGHYLKLQNERYNGKIQSQLQQEKECRTMRMPKMILQPLVENAIKYSHLKEGGKCILTVTVHREGTEVHLTITDNGIGISENQRQDIVRLYEKDQMDVSDGHGIGLLNVLFRLRIYFKENFSWNISSNQPGCIITLILPWEGGCEK